MNIKLNLPFFKIAYCLYYLTFFLEDLPLESYFNIDFSPIINTLRYFVYGVFVVHLIMQKLPLKKFVPLIFLTFLGAVIVGGTSSFYWVILPIIILSSINEDIYDIIKVSYRLLACSTVVVIFLCLIELLPDVLSYRTPFSPPRHSLGFYHSNVLPMIIFWLVSYKMILSSETKNLKWREIGFWFIIAIVVQYFCDSRNGFLSVLALLILYAFTKYTKVSLKKRGVLFYCSKFSSLICVLFSLVAMYSQKAQNSFWSLINSLFSGRFSAAYNQLEVTGINLLNLLPTEIQYVLDNGYLCVAFTFGIIFLLFYVLIAFEIAKRYEKNIIVLFVLCMVAIVNMVDNDLCSYGYLPIILLAFLSKNEHDKIGNEEIKEHSIFS